MTKGYGLLEVLLMMAVMAILNLSLFQGLLESQAQLVTLVRRRAIRSEIDYLDLRLRRDIRDLYTLDLATQNQLIWHTHEGKEIMIDLYQGRMRRRENRRQTLYLTQQLAMSYFTVTADTGVLRLHLYYDGGDQVFVLSWIPSNA